MTAPKNQFFSRLLGILLGISLAAFYGFFIRPFSESLSHMAHGDDAERSNQLGAHLTQTFPFMEEGNEQAPAFFFANPSRHATRLFLYGVTNLKTQAELISAVRAWQNTNPSLTQVTIHFFDRATGRSAFGEILPKEPLGTVTVETPTQ